MSRANTSDVTLHCGDNLEIMRGMPDRSVNLTFTSSPYEAARTYAMDFNLKGQAFVDWFVERFVESLRVTDGLVAWVIEGQTRQYRWSATPALIMADLHRRGVHLRKPPIYQRVGIPGSGGPDWLRNDYEFIVCATNGGKLPWSENTACGHPPKWAPGGAMSHRVSNGARVNQWGHSIDTGATNVTTNGSVRSNGKRPSHRQVNGSPKRFKRDEKMSLYTPKESVGDTTVETQSYLPPAKANPGNVIKCKVGGGLMGHALSHENEAPFPLALAEFFVRSFCPPGGIVLDPHSGSGTTGHAALMHGRRYIGIDIRESQIDLTRRRLDGVQPLLLTTPQPREGRTA